MATRKSFLLRLNADLYDEVRRWAEAELRSVNGQIEYLLREAVTKRRGRQEAGRGDLESEEKKDRGKESK
jgi:hypothetical protein